eukprot:COSAG01_NODE_59214_length_301_cov_1.282178_1_plen_56_part_01
MVATTTTTTTMVCQAQRVAAELEVQHQVGAMPLPATYGHGWGSWDRRHASSVVGRT